MNFDSKEWQEVKAEVEAAIEALKESLCSAQLTEIQTAYRRGGIAYLRAFLQWPDKESAAAEPTEPGIEFDV